LGSIPAAPAPTHIMETSEPGAARATGIPANRNTTPFVDNRRCVSTTPSLSGDPGQNLRRGHYELGLDVPPALRVAPAFTELAMAI
jgi:hypothetical protein